MIVKQVLSVMVGDHLLGIDICAIEDVLRRVRSTPVPLAGDKIAGLINLRGHIVTLIQVDRCLNLLQQDQANMNIVIEYRKELYGLLFDQIGDIQEIDMQFLEPVPRTLAPEWHKVSEGVCRVPEGLMIILNPYALIETASVAEQEAA